MTYYQHVLYENSMVNQVMKVDSPTTNVTLSSHPSFNTILILNASTPKPVLCNHTLCKKMHFTTYRERERDGPKPMGLLVQVFSFELGAVDFTKKNLLCYSIAFSDTDLGSFNLILLPSQLHLWSGFNPAISDVYFWLRDAFQIKKEKNFRQLSKRWEGVTLKSKIKIGN